MPDGFLTTHILDTAHGIPAKGVKISLYKYETDEKRLLASAVTNEDGRTDTPILAKDTFSIGNYELVFDIGAYYKSMGVQSQEPLFLDQVPVQFGINDENSHYHVPLLASPYGYSTYRGS